MNQSSSSWFVGEQEEWRWWRLLRRWDISKRVIRSSVRGDNFGYCFKPINSLICLALEGLHAFLFRILYGVFPLRISIEIRSSLLLLLSLSLHSPPKLAWDKRSSTAAQRRDTATTALSTSAGWVDPLFVAIHPNRRAQKSSFSR